MSARSVVTQQFARSWLLCMLAACSGTVSGKHASDSDAAVVRGHDAGHAVTSSHPGSDEDAGSDAAVEAPPAPSVCSSDGFCWELPTPQGETLRAVWVAPSPSSEIWAVGGAGLVLHSKGPGFTAEQVDTHQDLLAIDGSAADDVWAVGKGGAVAHFDGTGFSVTDLSGLIDASGGAMTGVLYGVYAAAKDAVWAVGYSGAGPLIVHYDGNHWSNQSLGLQTDMALRAVWGVARDHVWAVGDGGVIRSFDGTQWNIDKSPTQAALSSVHGLAQHDVWAVGAGGTAVHWNGTSWGNANMGMSTAIALQSVRVDIAAPPPSPDAGMAMMPAPKPADPAADAGPPKAPEGPWSVWAFGEKGNVLRYNGTVWAAMPSGTEYTFFGATRASAGTLIAVGERGQITRFQGDARQSLSFGSHENHLGLWGDGQSLWAVGDGVMHRDASGWSAPARPIERALYSVWGDHTGVWAVGTAGSIVHLKAGAWQTLEVAAAGETWLHGVYGADTSLWIVGDAGTALVAAAGSFIKVATPVKTNLIDVWGSADDRFWAVGDAGVVLRWDGMSWLKVPTGAMGGVSQNLRAIWGSADDDVWIVGIEGVILHWNGMRFEPHAQDAHDSLNDVWGRAKDDVYVVGSNGRALHFDGTQFQALETGTRSSLQSVFGDEHGRVFAAGLDGVVLVRQQ